MHFERNISSIVPHPKSINRRPWVSIIWPTNMDNGFAGTLKKTKPTETGSFCMQYQYHLHCYRTKNHLLRILPPKIYIFDTAETPLPNCLALTQSWKKPIFKWGGNPFPIFHPLSHHCLTPLKTLVKNSNRPKNVGSMRPSPRVLQSW